MASVFSFGFIAMYSSPNHWIWIILYSCVISLVCCVMVTLFSSIELRVDSIYVMYSIMMGCVLVGVLAILGHCLRSLMINYAYAYNNAPDNSVIQKLSDQAALSTLSMGIAHEIRNPMSGILARLELIESKPIVTQKDVSKLAQITCRDKYNRWRLRSHP